MKTLSAVKTRNSNIEMLRALAMLMIVAYHYSIMGFYAEDIMYSTNKSFIDILGMGGKLGTEIFVLISGYYMIRSRFTLRKLLSLMGQLWFYTLSALSALIIIKGMGAIDMSMLKYAFFPLLTSHYWFASYYVLLMLLSPAINFVLHKLNKAQHALLALFLFAVIILMPWILKEAFFRNLLWMFITLYITAAWFSLYIEPSNKLANGCLAAAVVVVVLCSLRIVISNQAAQAANDSYVLLNSVALKCVYEYSPYTFIISTLLLLGFCTRTPRQDSIAFALGGASFGVYLFHANIIVNEHIYQDIFHTSGYAEHPLLFVHAFCVVGIIYAFAYLLEVVRGRWIAPLWERLCDIAIQLAARACSAAEKVFNGKKGI